MLYWFPEIGAQSGAGLLKQIPSGSAEDSSKRDSEKDIRTLIAAES
jgi:hypothetical protein